MHKKLTLEPYEQLVRKLYHHLLRALSHQAGADCPEDSISSAKSFLRGLGKSQIFINLLVLEIILPLEN